MRVRASLVGACLALLVGAGAHAEAARAPARVVVATSADVQLLASDEDGRLCVGVHTPRSDSRSCEDSDLGVADLGGDPDATHYVGVATPASAATVEVRRAGQLLASAPTVTGEAYKGTRAGKVRFAIVPLPAGAASDGLRIRSLDAAGALVAVVAPDAGGELVVARKRLLSGRSGAVRWSIEANLTSTLRPSVLDLGHEAITRCVDTEIRSGHSGSGSTSCVGDAPLDTLELLGGDRSASYADDCKPPFRLMHGLVATSVQRVSFLLGDGTRRTARTTPFGDGRRLAYALVVPATAAVRSVTFDRGAGRPRVIHLGLAPLKVTCAAGDDDIGVSGLASIGSLASPFENLTAVTPVGPVTTVPGSPTFRVADGPGDTLCLAVGTLAFTPLSCGVVSPLLTDLLGAFDNFLAPRSFAIAVPARVAAIRVAAADGKHQRLIATVPGAGYGGPYAGHVRFASATVAATSDLDTLDLLDATGAVLHHEGDSSSGADELSAPRYLGARRVAGRAGHPSLWQTALRSDGRTQRCLALTDGHRPGRNGACQAVRSARSLLLSASCVSHRLTVAVAASAGTRVLAALDGSRTRAIALRGGAGLLTLPTKRSLRSITFVRGGKRTTVRLDAAPGERQCGWTAAPLVTPR